MDDDLMYILLSESEGNSIDFKKEQYKFIEASINEKAELLKDILAFSNTARRNDAYILIGVSEAKDENGRRKVVGIHRDDHIDDASLQQFVNEKTNEIVNFKYLDYTYKSKEIGIIQIENHQNVPIYLLNRFGQLNSNVVFIRIGSSTGIASLEFISKMRSTEPTKNIKVPNFLIKWCMFGDINKSFSVLNIPRVAYEEFDLDKIENEVHEVKQIDGKADPGWDRKVIHYFKETDLFLSYVRNEANRSEFIKHIYSFILIPITLEISNIGTAVANDIKVRLKLPKSIILFDESDRELPKFPSKPSLEVRPLRRLVSQINKLTNPADIGSMFNVVAPRINSRSGFNDHNNEFWIKKIMHKNSSTINVKLFMVALPEAQLGEMVIKGDIFCVEFDDWQSIKFSINVLENHHELIQYRPGMKFMDKENE